MINLYVVVLRHFFLHIFVESNNTFTFAFICFVLCEKVNGQYHQTVSSTKTVG